MEKKTMSPVIDKLQKLLNHERSARSIGNMAEAEAFAGKIAEMLFNHKLSMTEIEFADEERDEPIAEETIDGIRSPWAGTLAMGIAAASFCKVLKSSSGFVFIGRTSDRATAISLFQYLAVTGKRISDSELTQYKRTEKYTFEYSFRPGIARTWKASFLQGYAQAVYMRLQAERKKLTATAEQAGTSLVWINKSESALTSFMQEKYPRLRAGRATSSRVHGDAYRAGQYHGGQVSLSARGALTAGR
jgi:hypothetical protein